METKWTQAQQTVIDVRDKNILVSAAAGSGKTAVLVERIIQLVTDEKYPIDIDKLLVVTFTQAAASEMRERILNAIEKKVVEQPDNIHLQKQLTYIHNANISTLHKFCLNVIRENFSYIDIDPGFVLADEGDLTLIKADAMKEVLEKYYEEKRPDFVAFIEKYSSSRSDKEIENIIKRLFNFSMSYPNPEEWLDQCAQRYRINDIEEMLQADWMKNINTDIEYAINDIYRKLKNAKTWMEEPDGPYMYEEAVNYDILVTEQLINEKDFNKRQKILASYNPGSLSSKRDENVSPTIKEIVKNYRNESKDGLRNLRKEYFQTDLEEHLKYIKESASTANIIVELTKEYISVYNRLKKEKNRIDFNDIEHLALEILVKKDKEGNYVPTYVADEIAMQYEEIMVDEYQDSNYVQELIISSVSRERFGKPNVFMVGDVKQSIYKFRLARPEIFIDKYNTYTHIKDAKTSIELPGENRKIILDKNFRSREEILKPTNFIFKQVMTKGVGGIEYDEDNYLNLGAKYENIEEQSNKAEFLVVESKGDEGEEEIAEQMKAGQLEAHVVAKKIKELVGNFKVFDKDSGEYRLCKYSDIVILSRSVSSIMDIYSEILTNEGIPVYCEMQNGFFDAVEVVDILNLLKIIDNPRQDIPFVSVLTSAMFNISNDELAKIRSEYKKINYHEAIWKYCENGTDVELRNKLKCIITLIDKYRELVPYTSIYNLITEILDDTGYYAYISAMPGGKRRKANIDMLKEKAADYENGAYKGLFNFVRYIEKLEQYEVASAEASVVSENDNSVRVMTIHKSKGLEFPVVFLVSMGKQFNNADYISKIVIHPDLGIGIDYMDHINKLKVKTLIKKSIANKIRLEGVGEELRVLYVALTRAKEKLFMVTTVANLEKRIMSWLSVRNINEVALPYEKIMTVSRYSDIIGYALARNNCFKILLDKVTTDIPCFNIMQGEDSGIDIELINLNDIVVMKAQELADENIAKNSFREFECNRVYNENLKKELIEMLNFRYEDEALSNLYSKMSVSEIKNMDDEAFDLYRIEDKKSIIPQFISGKQQKDGAFRGTAFHRVFELFDFELEPTVDNYKNMVDDLVRIGKIEKSMADVLIYEKFVEFAKSDIFLRMKKAKSEGKLSREAKFVIGIPACDIIEKYNTDEKIVVQGIIDAYFKEDNQIVIVDYKTDYVENLQELCDKYKIQLEYYANAVEKLTGIKVKEKIIYSVHLSESINI